MIAFLSIILLFALSMCTSFPRNTIMTRNRVNTLMLEGLVRYRPAKIPSPNAMDFSLNGMVEPDTERFIRAYGPDNLDDIMGGCETAVEVNGTFNPMERIILTANGNLQHVMSAYYAAPVTVQVIKSIPISNHVFDREVNLLSFGKVFCNAKGKIEIFDEDCMRAIAGQRVGVGQLFRYLGVLPYFRLVNAGRRDDGSLWRDYELSCPQIRCRFLEVFSPDLLCLQADG